VRPPWTRLFYPKSLSKEIGCSIIEFHPGATQDLVEAESWYRERCDGRLKHYARPKAMPVEHVERSLAPTWRTNRPKARPDRGRFPRCSAVEPCHPAGGAAAAAGPPDAPGSTPPDVGTASSNNRVFSRRVAIT
jgi:hypothetical protein